MFLRLFFVSGVFALQTLPPTSMEKMSSDGTVDTGISFRDIPRIIYITGDIASLRDSAGLTLIPPSGEEFAQTFVQDLADATGEDWVLERVDGMPTNLSGILLTKYDEDPSRLSYESGVPTEEGYSLDIDNGGAVIRGSGARGMWWGTRTLLQQLMLSKWTSLPTSKVIDAPAYATRGFMLDAGRKWYEPSFLKDLCTYASFFKMSEFHYHTSDNYPLNRGRNETWNDVYAQFSLRPESSDLQGLVQRLNETLARADFEDLQSHCAQRGLTVIPEIEAPGHCLTITKWKPELALPKRDLLNLTHPDSIPTVQRIWEEFLPWCQTKEVHIGADEYDKTLADDYIAFVNQMARFVNETSGKTIRIWGTEEPSNKLKISKDVIVQHWQYGQSDPAQLQADGYGLINTQDSWAYMSLKNDHSPILPAPYPQHFNETPVLNFAGRDGWQWQPAFFNPVNITEQLKDGAAENKGAIMAAWNDNGPDASTQLEAFYAMHNGIPLVAARAWAGARGPQVEADTIDDSIDFLANRAPGQNLDRRLPVRDSPTQELAIWTRTSDQASETILLGYGSKGMNYSLTLSVNGSFTLTSNDTMLSLSDSGALVFNADGFEYPLRSVSEYGGFDKAHPGRIWTNATTSSHEPIVIQVPAEILITTHVLGGSRAWINGTFAGRFEVFVYGGRNTVFSWSQMAFVAPLQTLWGDVQQLVLRNGVHPPSAGEGNGTPPPASTGIRGTGGAYWTTLVCAGLVAMYLTYPRTI